MEQNREFRVPPKGTAASRVTLVMQRYPPLNLLLLEDNPHDVWQFTLFIRPEDAAVTVVENGAEALDRIFRRGKFQNSPLFDLVVADLNVPLLNGHEVLNVIKGNSVTRHIPVIVWTISDNPRDVHRAFDLGCCAYMIKPVDINETSAQLEAFKEFWLRRTRYPMALNRPGRENSSDQDMPLSA